METHFIFFFILMFSYSPSNAYGEIRKELRNKKVDLEATPLVGHLIQHARIDPSRVIQLSWLPRVFIYRGFLSDEECDHLISLEKEKYSDVNGEEVGTIMLPKDTTISISTKDDVAARIEDKISAWSFLPKEYSKPLQILHFGHEGREQNCDYFGKNSSLLGNEPLMATVILYLSNVSHGGQILFPQLKSESSLLKKMIWSDCSKSIDILRPVKGNAILFFSTHPNATPDKSSLHARCPVTDNEMWCATKYFYLKRVVAEKAQLQMEDGDCTDEDESCPEWAALGECKRNPVFMVGSPDYYGTCRKSCNSC